MRYFDTSYLARCYVEDTGWEAVRALADEEPVACCSLGRAEIAAAVHRKLREGSLKPEDHAEVALQFRDDCEAGLWRWLPIGDALAAAAAENGFIEVFSHDRGVQKPSTLLGASRGASRYRSCAQRRSSWLAMSLG